MMRINRCICACAAYERSGGISGGAGDACETSFGLHQRGQRNTPSFPGLDSGRPNEIMVGVPIQV
eukprot:scaffold359790_cov40-Prasinocladus_malaysianus.AAC.1